MSHPDKYVWIIFILLFNPIAASDYLYWTT